MKLKAAFLISALNVAVLAPAHAEAPRSVDARTFDIAGVKTGMDYDEAVAAAAKNFQVSKSEMKAGYATLNPVTNTKTPLDFSYRKDGVELVVHFEPRVPVDKQRPLAVSLINYEMPWTPANKAAMGQAVVQKYGRQSNYPNDLSLEWCQKPSSNLGMGCSIDMKQAVLNYTGVSIRLYDPAWSDARVEFINQSNARKPSF